MQNFWCAPCAALYIVAVYIPHQYRDNPGQAEVLEALRSVISEFPRDCAVLVMGDFNAQLSRNIDRRTGRWCVRDEIVDDAGRLLLRWMQECCAPTGMWASSTQFTGPGRARGRHATYVLPGVEEKRVQLDYVMANRHARPLVRNCVVKWQGPITIHDRPADHALIETDLDVRVRARTDTVDEQPDVPSVQSSLLPSEPLGVEDAELEEGEIPE